jgi:pimeloyl-ACP methyl ester carboxylesterase
MSTFVLLPGAGSDSWYWHLVSPRLQAAGHDVVAVDLPVDDDATGLEQYTGAALSQIGDRADVVLVAQSMSAYTASLAASRRPVTLIVLVAPMIPAPGETPGQWWDNTGQPAASRQQAIQDGRDPDAEFDPVEIFLHDVAPDVAAASADHVRRQSDRPFSDPWALSGWPDVPTRAIFGRQDRLFPLPFQKRVVAERLGLAADEIESGHLPALSRPEKLAELLLGYLKEAPDH